MKIKLNYLDKVSDIILLSSSIALANESNEIKQIT
jgi:hypothetical protein